MKFNKKTTIIALAVVVVLLLLLYLIIDPGQSHFAPKCIFKLLFKYDCPTCGSQRVVHALLNGEFVQALRYNPFFFIAVPYTLAIIYSAISNDRFAVKVKRVTHHHITIYIFVAIYILWWILRNTPLWPFRDLM